MKRVLSILIALAMLAINRPASAISALQTFNCGAVSEIPQSECAALVALYNSTNGPAWSNHTNWLTTNPPSTWFGVTVTLGHVTSLYLTANNLVGTIPGEIGNLANLVHLSLSQNSLSGSIPTQIGSLHSLVSLYLRNNDLTGSIPVEMGSLSNLTVLDLHFNQLSGPIPSQMGNLSKLTSLLLYGNWLTGGIPPELGNLPLIEYLWLSTNPLDGSIPSEIWNLSTLKSLSLNNNLLDGSIPPEVGNLTNLTQLYLYGNNLTGSIPPEIGQLTNLTELMLGYAHDSRYVVPMYNFLSGSIPPEIGNLSKLEYLALGGLQLSGSIPPEIGNLSALKGLFLHGNDLSGAIPPELGNLTNLVSLELHWNQLSGSIPSQLGNLVELTLLNLSNNLLSGNIPPELGNLTKLELLQMKQNQLTGSIPASFLNLVNLAEPGTLEGNYIPDGLVLDYNGLLVPGGYPNPSDALQVLLHAKDPDWHLNQSFEKTLDTDGGGFSSLDGKATISVSGNVLSGETTFSYIPQPTPSNPRPGELHFANNSFQIQAQDGAGNPITAFGKPIQITISYSDGDVAGLDEQNLKLYYWDETEDRWVDAVTTCANGEYTRDLPGNSFTAPVCHFSEFAVLGPQIYGLYLPSIQR